MDSNATESTTMTAEQHSPRLQAKICSNTTTTTEIREATSLPAEESNL